MIILEDTDLHSFKFDKLKVINVNIKGIIKENMERKLREKVGDKYFKTVKGVGYKFVIE